MAFISHSLKKRLFYFDKARWQTLFQILGASGIVALCSQIEIPLPFTPVPITAQTLAVLLIGASLGSRNGGLAILCYFVEILMGLPVLSGGSSNPLVFLSPTGGYVLGFFFQAALMGWFCERSSSPKPAKLLLGGLVSCSLQLIMGVFILAQFVGWNHVWVMGLFPFIPGEILKVLLVSFGIMKNFPSMSK